MIYKIKKMDKNILFKNIISNVIWFNGLKINNLPFSPSVNAPVSSSLLLILSTITLNIKKINYVEKIYL